MGTLSIAATYEKWKSFDSNTLENNVLPTIREMSTKAHNRGEIYLWMFFKSWEKKVVAHLASLRVN